MRNIHVRNTPRAVAAIALALGLLCPACRPAEGGSSIEPAELRARVRRALADSPEVGAIFDRLAAHGCAVSTSSLARWQVGITRGRHELGAAVLEAFECDGAMGLVALGAAGSFDVDEPLEVTAVGAIRSLPSGAGPEEPLLWMHDDTGALREVALTADVAAAIETALAAEPEPSGGVSTAALLGPGDLDELMSACALVLSNTAPNPPLAENANDCADCLAHVAQCLGVVNRLAQAEGECMQLLYCSVDAPELGLDRVGPSTVSRWFGGRPPADVCVELATSGALGDEERLAECRDYYEQTGALMRGWSPPVMSGCGADGFYDYGDVRTWDAGCFDGGVINTIHRGNDCANPPGTEVTAIGPGEVVRSGDGYTCGVVVVVRHDLSEAERAVVPGNPSVVYSHYGHLDSPAAVGTYVEAGDHIGNVTAYSIVDGSDVCSGGGNAHLHWELETHRPASGSDASTSDFTCDGSRDRAVSPGYSVGDVPAAASGWYNPEVTLAAIADAALHEPPGGFLESLGGAGRATLSASTMEGLRQLGFSLRVQGALEGLFGQTDLTVARAAGYFLNFALLAWHRQGFMGEGPGSQFFCADTWEERFSCYPPLCFDGADSSAADPCFEMRVTCAATPSCADPITTDELPEALRALAPTAELGADGCCPADLRVEPLLDTEALSPAPDPAAPPVAPGYWTDGFSFYPRATVPAGLCAYALVDTPLDEGTYRPLSVSGDAVLTRDWTCPPPPPAPAP
jgi:hypothetical protein